MRKLTDILESMGVVTAADVERAVARHRATGTPVGRCLIEMGICDEGPVAQALGLQRGLRRVSLRDIWVHPDVLRRLPEEMARWHNALPIQFLQDPTGAYWIEIAMSDPDNTGARRSLQGACGFPVVPVVAGDDEIAQAIDGLYGQRRLQALADHSDLHAAGLPPWIDLSVAEP